MKQIEITNTITLWNTFEKTARFGDTEYDSELKKRICTSIGIKTDEPIPALLQKHNISVERLLYAILQAMEPFSIMLTDLLQMFECASAQASSTNLQIKFNFDKDKIPLNFDLENFRQTVHSASRHLIQRQIRIVQNPWGLIGLFCQKCKINDAHACSPQVKQWLDEYNNEDRWPDSLPDVPKTGYDALDSTVNIIWGMIQSAIAYYRQAYIPEKGRTWSHQEECCRREYDRIWLMETDHWVGRLISSMDEALTDIRNSLNKDGLERASALAQELQVFLEECAISEREIIEIAESLEDILNLPYWERRYELYSAWILTQITKGLQDTGISYHVVDGVLSFSFRGTLMATCENLRPPLQIWAELRTKSTAPMKGTGRKKHIQPDYTLAIDDAEQPENTVAVVECKQYKQSKKQNFFSAISDYAAGRPNGNIFLVNYGPISDGLLSGGEQSLKKRAFPYEHVRPGSTNADDFRRKLKEMIYTYYRRRALTNPRFLYPWSAPGTPCTITLTWGQVPTDLDLWLCVNFRNGRHSAIGFQNPGDLEQEPFVCLDRDCRTGFGPETIKIGRWLDAGYDVVIDNFSGESKVEESVKVCISCGQDNYSITSAKVWRHPFVWHAIHLEPLGFQVIHQCFRAEQVDFACQN